MVNATTDDVTMDTLDALIIKSIETIRYSKKKRPDKVKLAEITYRLAFLIKEGRLESQHCLVTITLILPMKARLKLIMLLPQLLLSQCANNLNSLKEHITVLNTEIAAMG